jgi:hypothetical protein
MKASELMHNNLVQTNQGVFKVYNFTHTLVTLEPFLTKEHHVRELTEIDFIPLTEEWLLRFGFEMEQTMAPSIELMEYYSLDGFRFMKDIDNKWFLMGYNWNAFHFKYVHQLQNLYFALTGE